MEVHHVCFEGHLGSYDNQVSSLLRLKKQMFKVLSSLRGTRDFDCHEWKITDLDRSLYRY